MHGSLKSQYPESGSETKKLKWKKKILHKFKLTKKQGTSVTKPMGSCRVAIVNVLLLCNVQVSLVFWDMKSSRRTALKLWSVPRLRGSETACCVSQLGDDERNRECQIPTYGHLLFSTEKCRNGKLTKMTFINTDKDQASTLICILG